MRAFFLCAISKVRISVRVRASRLAQLNRLPLPIPFSRHKKTRTRRGRFWNRDPLYGGSFVFDAGARRRTRAASRRGCHHIFRGLEMQTPACGGGFAKFSLLYGLCVLLSFTRTNPPYKSYINIEANNASPVAHLVRTLFTFSALRPTLASQ